MADFELKQQDKDIKTLSTAELDQKVQKQGMKFEFADSKKAAKSILTLKRSDLPRGYKSKVAQGILNRIDSALSRTKDKIKVFNIKKARALWEKFFDAFAEENPEDAKKAAPEEEDMTKVKDLGAQGADTTLEESGYQIVRNDAGDSGVIAPAILETMLRTGDALEVSCRPTRSSAIPTSRGVGGFCPSGIIGAICFAICAGPGLRKDLKAPIASSLKLSDKPCRN